VLVFLSFTVVSEELTDKNAAKTAIENLLSKADKLISHNKYEQALELLIQAYENNNVLNDVAINNTILNTMANAYYNTGQLDLAHRYYSKLKDIDEQSGDTASLSVTLFNLGHVNASLKQFDQATDNFKRSLDLSKQLNDESGIAYTLKAMGVNEHAQSRLTPAILYLQQALLTFQSLGDNQQAARVQRHLGDIAQQQNHYAKALMHYKIALSELEKEPLSKALMRTHRGLSFSYQSLEQHALALEHHIRYKELLEQQLEMQNTETTRRIQAQFETKYLEAENERLELLSQHQQAELKHRKDLLHMQYLLIALAGGIIFLVLALWSRSRHHAYSMEKLASIDDLTGLQNRRAVLQSGADEFGRSVRFNRDLCCLILDIDHFKDINDNYGHATGDEVLKAFANMLANTVRQADILGRIGGEEFLIIAGETDIAQATVLADRIRANTQTIEHDTEMEEPITVSIGIAELKEQESLGELISLADKALYKAKDNGRDQTIIFDID
jgi:diguanylate cyclase (GGDEF)-like protein